MLHLRDLTNYRHGYSPPVIWGNLCVDMKPLREAECLSDAAAGKVVVPWDVYEASLFPPFMSWPGYVMTKMAARDIMRGKIIKLDTTKFKVPSS